MSRDPINAGYARAWFEMAQAEGVTDRVEEELFRLRELLRQSPELLQFLKDPNVQREGKRRALAELFQGRVHALVLNLLLTLSDQDRGNRLVNILEEFTTLKRASGEKVSGALVTAQPLDAVLVQQLETELGQVLGKQVQLFQKVDPGILGGVIVKVGEQVLDASLRRKLEQLRERLAQ